MFTVDPERLDVWSARVSGLVDDADQATRYVDAHLRVDGSGPSPAFSNAMAGVEEARAALTASMGRLQELLGASAGELTRSAALYRSIDRAEAARLDALLDSARPADAASGPPVPPGPVAPNPATALQPPTAHDPIPPQLEAVLGIAEWVSPAHLVMELLNLICGSNPVTYVAESLAGDWTGLSTVSDACRKLADFDSAMGSTIRGYAEATIGGSAAWQGEAAGAAGAYFTGFAGSVAGQAGAVDSFGRQCQALAAQTYVLITGIEDLLTYLIDLAISGVIVMASAGIPLVGTFAAGVAGAFVVAQGIRTWAKILDRISEMSGLANLFVGTAGAFAGSLRELSRYRLPAGAYDHPGV